MADKQAIRSEGEQLEEVLDALQRDHAVKEIAGWESGFDNLSRALDGIRPGLHLLVGPPGIGKTSFAKQLLDQVAMRNSATGVFISCAESKQELRIKTLARLSEMDSREIRRGSAYLLHWYGVPRLSGNSQVKSRRVGKDSSERQNKRKGGWIQFIWSTPAQTQPSLQSRNKSTRSKTSRKARS